VAGAAAPAGGAKPGAASEEKKASNKGEIPVRPFGSTSLELIRTGGFDQVMLARGCFNGYHQMISARNLERRELCLSEARERRMATVQMKVFTGKGCENPRAKNLKVV
jgi:hypothetical protein